MDVEKIAALLSKAQKRSILAFRWNQDGTALHCPRHRDGGQMKHSLEQLGLCSEAGRMTARGLAVRTHLENTNHD